MNTAVAAQEQQAPETVAAGKTKLKSVKSGNILLDIATEVEGLSKTKALNMAEDLANDIETNYFKLGGVLQLIAQNSWYEGYNTFDDFIRERYGFQGRKARYLIAIYADLVTKQIPWEKVGPLGWTKLKDLAPVLTLENVDEWVAKAGPVTVLELQAMLKATSSPTGESSGTTKSNLTTLKFPFAPDALNTVQSAIAKAKGELNTEFDNVAVENICAGYLAGHQSAGPAKSLEQMITEKGWQETLNAFSAVFPTIDVSLKVPDEMMK